MWLEYGAKVPGWGDTYGVFAALREVASLLGVTEDSELSNRIPRIFCSPGNRIQFLREKATRSEDAQRVGVIRCGATEAPSFTSICSIQFIAPSRIAQLLFSQGGVPVRRGGDSPPLDPARPKTPS